MLVLLGRRTEEVVRRALGFGEEQDLVERTQECLCSKQGDQ